MMKLKLQNTIRRHINWNELGNAIAPLRVWLWIVKWSNTNFIIHIVIALLSQEVGHKTAVAFENEQKKIWFPMNFNVKFHRSTAWHICNWRIICTQIGTRTMDLCVWFSDLEKKRKLETNCMWLLWQRFRLYFGFWCALIRARPRCCPAAQTHFNWQFNCRRFLHLMTTILWFVRGTCRPPLTRPTIDCVDEKE